MMATMVGGLDGNKSNHFESKMDFSLRVCSFRRTDCFSISRVASELGKKYKLKFKELVERLKLVGMNIFQPEYLEGTEYFQSKVSEPLVCATCKVGTAVFIFRVCLSVKYGLCISSFPHYIRFSLTGSFFMPLIIFSLFLSS